MIRISVMEPEPSFMAGALIYFYIYFLILTLNNYVKICSFKLSTGEQSKALVPFCEENKSRKSRKRNFSQLFYSQEWCGGLQSWSRSRRRSQHLAYTWLPGAGDGYLATWCRSRVKMKWLNNTDYKFCVISTGPDVTRRQKLIRDF